jgi:hypothetical protein
MGAAPLAAARLASERNWRNAAPTFTRVPLDRELLRNECSAFKLLHGVDDDDWSRVQCSLKDGSVVVFDVKRVLQTSPTVVAAAEQNSELAMHRGLVLSSPAIPWKSGGRHLTWCC